VPVSQITIPAPRTWAPGDLPTVPRLRADAVGAVALLLQRPLFIGQQTTGETVTTTNDVTVTLDTVLADTWAGFANRAGNVYNCELPGWYLCDARIPVNWGGGSASAFSCGFSCSTVNAGATAYGARTASTGASGVVTPRVVDLIPMITSSVTAVIARQETGSTLTLDNTSTTLPVVCMRWVCAATGTAGLPVPPLATCPTPITSAWLNANIRDTVNFLIYPPAFRGRLTSGSIATGTQTAVSLNAVDFDNYSAYSGGGAGYVAPVSGRYLVAGQVNYAASSSSAIYSCGVSVAGTPYWGGIVPFSGSSLAAGASVVKRVRVTAGQLIQLIVAQSSGGSLSINTAAATQTRMVIAWEGA
jgi:hypothetical protein